MTSAVRLHRVGRLAHAVVVLCVVSAALAVLQPIVTNASVDEAEAYLAGEVGDTDFVESIIGYAFMGIAVGLAVIATAVVTIIWMFRIASNHRALHRGTTWGPGWAIGGWFLPPILFVLPALVLDEMWKASDPDVPVGGDWRRGRRSPLVIAWFVLYGVVPAILTASDLASAFGAFGGTEQQLAEQITGSQTVPNLSAATTVAAAVVFVLLVRSLTARHRRLTGEASR
jgi:hypothetical protein